MPLNMQLVRQRRKQIQKQEEDRKKGKNFDELKEGPNKRRICPPWPGSEDWRKYAAYHFNVLEKEAVLCPKKTFNKPCPICEYNEELYASDDKADKDEAKKIRAKDRFFANVLNLDKNDAKVYIMGFGQTIEEQIINIIDPGGNETEDGKESADSFGYGDITDPKSGRTLLITKTVPSDPTQTSYEVAAATSPSAVPNWTEIEKLIHNLDDYVANEEYTYEELAGMLDGSFKPDSKANTTTEAAAPKQEASKEEFSAPPKKEEKQITEGFEAPKSVAPTNAPKVENSQPAKTMSAIDRLKARKAAEGK